ncbi:transcriptional regulator [Desulfocucumis palustris]|uniref:Transcriptional regulator n=1 Tax=Desulfocucumis palustris TaxID=1898651 RepID=A0A2L2XGI4_9FIRM|nr:GntR family transcriptional regulator [Desulfocucumis palustris]GBF33001.1 transcriptional regulator [Desulfocucumis palustris]
MLIFLAPQNPTPFYQQIVEQIKNKIFSGELTPHESLPSIRQLAKELTTSVITTKRAYEELEREGLIYTRAGKGSFVSQVDTSARRKAALASLEKKLREIVEEALAAGIRPDQVKSLLSDVLDSVRGREQ